MQEDLEVTGISRSGRVRKKSSKLMDFESPDDIETRFRRQTPVKSYANFRQEDRPESQDFAMPEPQRAAEDAGTASGSESDYYENPGDNADSMESDSSASDEGGPTRTPANSLYMMEKSAKKKLIIKDGRVVGRAKAQRKDKGKTRITAYMMWAKEARNELLRKHPDMDFSAISKRLGEMWSNVNYNERYLWKRKAKRFAIQKEQSNQSGANKIISNPSVRPTGQVGPGRPPTNRAEKKPPTTSPSQALVVQFDDKPPKVHVMRVWAFAARQARAGHWERYAVDRERFKRRIADVDVAVSWVLKPQHRSRVMFQRFMPWWNQLKRKELAERKEREAEEKRQEELKKKEQERLEAEKDSIKEVLIAENGTLSTDEEKDDNEQLNKKEISVIEESVADKKEELRIEVKAEDKLLECNNNKGDFTEGNAKSNLSTQHIKVNAQNIPEVKENVVSTFENIGF